MSKSLTIGQVAAAIGVSMQMAVYAGFPAALNALFAAHEVFVARGAKQGQGDADCGQWLSKPPGHGGS
jgi:hypothetical protein